TLPYTGTGDFTVNAGSYSYTVTDANGCSSITSGTISQPTELIASSTFTPISCNGGSSTVTVNATGGTLPYTGTGDFVVNTGSYSYTVTDANGCTSITSGTISQPTELITSSTFTDILCNGGNSTVTVSASGGTLPYSGVGTFTETAGTYSYTVTDANGCTSVTSGTISQPTELIASSTFTPISCNGGNSTVTVSATGGTLPYTGIGNFIVNAGDYSYTVTDANGCSSVTSGTVTQPEMIVLTAIVDENVSCNGLADGQATASAIGGTEPYTYHWDNPSSSYGSTVSQLPAGNWTVQLTDNNGCTAERTISITEPLVLSVNINANNILCFGENTGSATAIVSGGTYPYYYNWSSGQNSASISNLSAGPYSLTVTDANNCQTIGNISLSQATELNVFLTSSPATCGGQGGSIVASVVGGSPNYQFAWSNGGNQNNIQNLNPGNYNVIVSDSHGCSKSQSIDVDIVGSINAEINVISPISCYGNQDGALQAISSNGKTPLSFEWNTGATSSTITNIGNGMYNVIITDDWGCMGNTNYVLIEPTSIVVHENIQNTSCYGMNDGSISIQASGGTQPYTYLWSNAQTTSSISNLIAGNYSLTVYDSSACSIIETYELSQPDKLNISLDIKQISCYGFNDGAVKINASGGTQPYAYKLENQDLILLGQMISPLGSGFYTAIVSDINSCSDSAFATITSPAELKASYSAERPSCNGAKDGYIEIAVIGGTEPYLFETNNAIVDIPLISGLGAGTYMVNISDANDCKFEFKEIFLAQSDIECLKIPNAFTPNGDGINDTWKIENIEMFSGARIFVYNRWGQEIWMGYPGDEWDGKFNSKLVPTGVYLYVIELYNGHKAYTGTVSVVY
ncbi:MAG: gliding motility-associated C-terminal domain-containing protein, partial [Bacteroidales bacterium]|nr:gliding motility-associated C-terminal domain-containing protein [Bacteroidales bacterium]